MTVNLKHMSEHTASRIVRGNGDFLRSAWTGMSDGFLLAQTLLNYEATPPASTTPLKK